MSSIDDRWQGQQGEHPRGRPTGQILLKVSCVLGNPKFSVGSSSYGMGDSSGHRAEGSIIDKHTHTHVELANNGSEKKAKQWRGHLGLDCGYWMRAACQIHPVTRQRPADLGL